MTITQLLAILYPPGQPRQPTLSRRPFSAMRERTWHNEASTVDGGIPFLSHLERACPAATDSHCWVTRD